MSTFVDYSFQNDIPSLGVHLRLLISELEFQKLDVKVSSDTFSPLPLIP